MHRGDARAERKGRIAAPRAGRFGADDAVRAPGQKSAEEQRPIAGQFDMHRVGGIAARREAPLGLDRDRSEEHTSELQSLMRISYAVFCLKQKKKTINQPQQTKTNTRTLIKR